MSDFSLCIGDNILLSSNSNSNLHTYCHPYLGFNWYIDFFVICPSLQNAIMKYEGLDLAPNLSDHLVVAYLYVWITNFLIYLAIVKY